MNESINESVESIKSQLILLYKELYNHTYPDCKKICKTGLGSCCDDMYGGIAEIVIRDFWKQPVPPVTRNSKCRFLSDSGCVLEPHLRPLCTRHHCDIHSLGFKKTDIDGSWTEAYFELCEKIDILEYKLSQLINYECS